MQKEISKIFQVAAVFIGTIVGAGLASGKEITQFFTSYGYKSFIGIILTGIFYIYMCSIIGNLSIKYNLNSYSEVIELVNSKRRSIRLGSLISKSTSIITTLYILSSASIILAGCGSLLNQYFGIPKLAGTLIMAALAVITLWKETEGLIGINSIIVPSLIIVIVTILILYIFFFKDYITLTHLKSLPAVKSNWLLSCILYSGYNILCCTGVIVPLSREMKSKRAVTLGIILGSLGLTLLCIFINLMLMLNQPYIYQYEIPLLYISNRFGTAMQIMLLIIIWLEMFSTEVSDIYSISRSLERIIKLPFKKNIFIVLAVAFPISQIGFANLISILYPLFGVLSLLFIAQCLFFYYSHK
ncbi:transporter [Clostridium polynesiense]|uniref:YkvI family membrane protein n=1 Tax=Clostridium polynesiense TaxID=1325933 RepID=UPI00058FC124|nr:transporter [Clostridium polynesiense]